MLYPLYNQNLTLIAEKRQQRRDFVYQSTQNLKYLCNKQG